MIILVKMSALEFGTIYFFLASSILRGWALLNAAKYLSTFVDVVAREI
jgi:hypothetical protein